MNNNDNILVFNKMKVDSALLEQIARTYHFSFPEDERRDFSLVRKLITDEPVFSVYALMLDDVYIGFLTTWKFKEFTYVEHFAIESTARNGGVGTKVLHQFLEKEENVILEVEVPQDDLTKRRVSFYQRLGFVLDAHTYFQPPYRLGEDKIEMRLMSFGTIDLDEFFEKVKDVIYERVYQQVL